VKLIQDCVVSSVTRLSAVFLLFPINSSLNEEDLQVLNVMKGLFGEVFKKNTFLVFTHSDFHQLSTLTERVNEFLSSEISAPFLEFCQGGIHFSGVINGELASELGPVYVQKVQHKVICLRQNLLESIMATEDIKIEFSQKENIKGTTSPSISIDEGSHKDSPSETPHKKDKEVKKKEETKEKESKTKK